MKNKAKIVLSLLLAVLLFVSFPMGARADADKSWTVAFTAEGKMDDKDLKASDLSYDLSGLQPGDDMTTRIYLKNDYAEPTDWYMTNKILKSLEDTNFDANGNRIASGGAYTYVLSFVDADGTREEIYNSETVGGDSGTRTGRTGLYEATEALEDFFYLFTLKPGQSGYVELYVLLDGETQGNIYQQTLAQIQMQFMVLTEEESSPESSTPPPPNTGDDTNALPYFITIGVAGAVVLCLGVMLVVRRKKERAEEET